MRTHLHKLSLPNHLLTSFRYFLRSVLRPTHLSVGLGWCLGFAAVVRQHRLAPRHLEGNQVLHYGVESLPLIWRG